MVMMKNLTHVKNWNLKKGQKLVGITKLWMVWDDIWKYSIWSTKSCQRPKLTSEVTSKTCQNDFKLHTCGWFGMILEDFQSDPPKEVRGQSWPQRSLQRCVKMTSNYILVDGLGWYLRKFNLNHQKRSEAKVDLGGHFKNMSKWLQITYLCIVWDDIWEYSIWPA